MQSVPPRCRKKSSPAPGFSHRGSPLLGRRPPLRTEPSGAGGEGRGATRCLMTLSWWWRCAPSGPLRPILGGIKGHEAVPGIQVLSAEPVLKTTQAGCRPSELSHWKNPRWTQSPGSQPTVTKPTCGLHPVKDGSRSPFWDTASGPSILLLRIRRPSSLTFPFPCKQISVFPAPHVAETCSVSSISQGLPKP